VGETILLDLNYEEDSSAHVDMNVVKTGRGLFVEVQGTAEGQPFSEAEMQELMGAADTGIKDLVQLQRKALGDFEPRSA
jgi:ribonuclease PH